MEWQTQERYHLITANTNSYDIKNITWNEFIFLAFVNLRLKKSMSFRKPFNHWLMN